jgi:hypothetical protein
MSKEGSDPGVTFNVHITRSKREAVYDFSFTRVGPG